MKTTEIHHQIVKTIRLKPVNNNSNTNLYSIILNKTIVFTLKGKMKNILRITKLLDDEVIQESNEQSTKGYNKSRKVCVT